MARQPTEKLQGYGQTSAPSAAPIDSYTGAPQVARTTPATQLAQALGTMSSSVAKAGARAEAAEKDAENERAGAYAEAVTIEDKEFGVDNLASLHPSLSAKQRMQLAETTSYNMYTTLARKRYAEFVSNEANLLNPESFQQFQTDLLAEFDGQTVGRDFVNAGARRAANELFRANTGDFISESDKAVKAHWGKQYKASMFHIFDNAKNADGTINMDIATAAFGVLDNQVNPYKKNVEKLREITITNLLSYDIDNPNKPITEDFIEAVPWLDSKITQAQLKLGKPKVLESLVTNIRNKKALKEKQEKEQFETGEMLINQAALGYSEETGEIDPDATYESKLQNLQSMRSQFLKAKPENVKVANDLIEVVDKAIDGLGIDAGISSERLATAENDLMVDASLREINSLEEMQKAIRNLEGLTPKDKGKLQAKAAELLNGSKLLKDSSLNSAFTARTASIESMFKNNTEMSLSDMKFIKTSGGVDIQSYFEDTFKKVAKRMIQAHLKQKDESPNDTLLQTSYLEENDGGIYGIALKEAREVFAYALEHKKMMDETVAQGEGGDGELPAITSQEEFDSLEPGAFYLWQGTKRQKPKAPVVNPPEANLGKDTQEERTVTDEQIEEFKGRNLQAEKMFEGLSNNAIRAAYGDEILSYVDMLNNREATEESIVDFFTNQLPDWFKTSTEKQAKINSLTTQERAVYDKTGKFPDEF